MKLTSLSACFPAYNEAANIPRLVEAFAASADRNAERWELIVVDDGSADGTGDVVESLAASVPGLRLVRHRENRGYGAAVRTGLMAAEMDYVFFCDADLQFDAEELSLLVPHAQSFDLVTGYRRSRRDNAVRRLNAFGWGRVVRHALGVRVRDLNCAFKLFSREALDKIGLDKLSSDGAFINAEMLARLLRAGGTIKEVPVSHYPRTAGTQTGANPRVILRAFGELMRLRRRLDE